MGPPTRVRAGAPERARAMPLFLSLSLSLSLSPSLSSVAVVRGRGPNEVIAVAQQPLGTAEFADCEGNFQQEMKFIFPVHFRK